jgi:hypothetical protein
MPIRQRGMKMKTINGSAITYAIQGMVDSGKITFMGDYLCLHTAKDSYLICSEESLEDKDKLFSAWNAIKSYQNKDGE